MAIRWTLSDVPEGDVSEGQNAQHYYGKGVGRNCVVALIYFSLF